MKRIQIGAWALLPEEQLLLDPDNTSIHLEPKLCHVLTKLACQPGVVFDRNRMLDEVWNDVIVSDNSLYRCVFQLRTHFATHPSSGISIENVRGKGYRLQIETDQTKRLTDPPLQLDLAKDPKLTLHTATTPRFGLRHAISRRPVRFVAGLSLLCVLAFGFGRLNRPNLISDLETSASEPAWAIEFFKVVQDIPGTTPITLELDQEQTVAKTLSIIRPEMSWTVDTKE